VSGASRRGHPGADLEGQPAGRRVRLPRGAEEPIRVYVNGIEQERDTDFTIDERGILFHEPIVKEGKLSGWRWLAMYVGLFGTYRKHETVDVEYRLDGKPRLASDLEVSPE
jgi:hypothetical protein